MSSAKAEPGDCVYVYSLNHKVIYLKKTNIFVGRCMLLAFRKCNKFSNYTNMSVCARKYIRSYVYILIYITVPIANMYVCRDAWPQ